MAAKKYTQGDLGEMTKGNLMQLLIREFGGSGASPFDFGTKEELVKEILKRQKSGGKSAPADDDSEEEASSMDVLKAIAKKFKMRVMKKDDEESLGEKIAAKWDDMEDVPTLTNAECDCLEEIGAEGVDDYRPDEEDDDGDEDSNVGKRVSVEYDGESYEGEVEDEDDDGNVTVKFDDDSTDTVALDDCTLLDGDEEEEEEPEEEEEEEPEEEEEDEEEDEDEDEGDEEEEEEDESDDDDDDGDSDLDFDEVLKIAKAIKKSADALVKYLGNG